MEQVGEPGGDAAAVRAVLAARKQAVEAYLERFLAEQLEHAAGVAPESRRLLAALRQFVLAGGKRIRASLVAAGYRCYAEEPADERLVAAGAAVELLHGFLLAHDDVFDRDPTRHGAPTLHRRFTDDLTATYPEADAARYGASLAILAGDVSGMLAYEALCRAPASAERLLPALRLLAGIALDTGYGEALDVLAELEPGVDAARVLQIHRYKTAKYTIEGPLQIGAILAGAGQPQLAALSAYAVPLGIAYQLQDDLLGAFGSEEVTGKPVGADLREGKRTLLSVHGLRGPFADSLRRLIGNPELAGDGVAQAQELLRRGGSLADSERQIGELLEQSHAALDRLDIRSDAKGFLRGLMILLVDRRA